MVSIHHTHTQTQTQASKTIFFLPRLCRAAYPLAHFTPLSPHPCHPRSRCILEVILLHIVCGASSLLQSIASLIHSPYHNKNMPRNTKTTYLIRAEWASRTRAGAAEIIVRPNCAHQILIFGAERERESVSHYAAKHISVGIRFSLVSRVRTFPTCALLVHIILIISCAEDLIFGSFFECLSFAAIQTKIDNNNILTQRKEQQY